MTGRRLTPAGLAGAFDRAAARYDLMVALNPGYHRHLRDAARRLLQGIRPRVVVDLGCGSGASTGALLRVADTVSHDGVRVPMTVIGIDASDGMLEKARRKRWPDGVRFVHGPAQQVRDLLGEQQPDAVFAAYLFRNLTPADRDSVLADLLTLLPSGGRLVVQDYAFGDDRTAPLRWSAVCWSVVIPLAAMLQRDTAVYRYLWRSVPAFDRAEGFAARLAAAGFTGVEVHTVSGWQSGILHTFVAHTP